MLKHFKKENGFEIEFEDANNGLICEVCFNPVDTDIRYCQHCKEYVEGKKSCPDCNGEGEVWDNNYMPSNPNLIDRPTKPCNNCGGTGVI